MPRFVDKTQTIGLSFMAPRIDAWRGFVVRINTHDHGPPHVHVVNSDVDLRVYLDDLHPPRIVKGSMAVRDVRAAAEYVRQRRDFYLEVWREIDPIS